MAETFGFQPRSIQPRSRQTKGLTIFKERQFDGLALVLRGSVCDLPHPCIPSTTKRFSESQINKFTIDADSHLSPPRDGRPLSGLLILNEHFPEIVRRPFDSLGLLANNRFLGFRFGRPFRGFRLLNRVALRSL